MKKTFSLKIEDKWTISDWESIANGKVRISFSSATKKSVHRSRKILEDKIASGDIIYGVNTGFGSLCSTSVSQSNLKKLQVNLIRSHAAGTGNTVSPQISRLMLVSKIRALSKGYSGVRWDIIEFLNLLYSHDILPVIPEMGSLGASGDLAPLAHMSLVLIGEGEVFYEKKRFKAKDVLKKLNIAPVELVEKEGLALINGTQFMLSHGLWAIIQARYISYWADWVSSMSIIGFDASSAPFDPRIQKIRNQKGQMFVSKRIREFLLDCPSFIKEKDHIQDPYSFRCIPQVHGASNDSWTHVQEVFLNEADAVTDNPTVFSDEVISAGNFHGQKLALAMDYGKMALAEWGSISERRINQLTLGKRGLKPFLATNPGLESGLMILQYSAAALVSRNKQRTVPSSTDSIDSSAGQEDHVSMGANAATDLIEVINGVWKIVSMELVCAIRSIESGERESSKLIQDFINSYRSIYPSPKGDSNLSEEINAAEIFLRDTLIEDSEFLIFNE